MATVIQTRFFRSSMRDIRRRMVLMTVMVLTTIFGFSQTTEQEKLRQLEMQRQADRQRIIDRQVDSIASLIEVEQYDEAEKMIVIVLQSVRSVPSSLTFYIGKNSYYLAKYKQSVDWLNKYIQLKGTAGQFSEEAILLKTKAENELVKERLDEGRQATLVFSKDFDLDCGPTGKVTCPVCNGTTVIIKRGYFGDTYKTCGFCQHTGVLSCEDYNKLLKGQLKPSTQ